MDRTKTESAEGIGSVKAAISFYGERINGRKPENYKAQVPLHEVSSPSKTGELHLAQMDKGRLHETKNSAEKEKAYAESELLEARNMAKELARQIDETNARARERRSELQAMKKPGRSKKEREEASDRQHAEVIQELDAVKKELSKMKLDLLSALEAKAKSEKEIEVASSKLQSYSLSAEELKMEIEDANEEHVLVELARIEAERECRDIEAQRASEADQFAKDIEAAKKRIKHLQREISHAKELEMKLTVTNSDVDVLQTQMVLVRAMERNQSIKRSEEDSDARSRLQSAETELKEAKKELASIKKDGFQIMASMDLIRMELMPITEETNRLNKLEKKADSNVQHLNSKLLKAKSKLETASRADGRAKAIVSNLSVALQQLHTEIESVKKEKEMIEDETSKIRAETDKMVEISSSEERLQAAVQGLEAVKASEAFALKKLKSISVRTLKDRANNSTPGSSSITISKSEYEYLSRGAAAAQLVADKKVAASEAWVEALRAAEKEIIMRTEFAEKEIKILREMEEETIREMERSLAAQNATEEELLNWRQNVGEVCKLQRGMIAPRKSLKENGIPVASRRISMRRISASSVTRNARSPSFTIKRRRKVMPNLVKFLKGRRVTTVK
ncbi:protein PLASTID MOVEMENT IMPAIRED 2 [Typha angustifolia]|uniref:protein PLASTID MOVEMENT IMPAIRED 2 n=1 Tax=Typha angustifolia TaxID=59011 RepID=UPI003C300EE7